MKLLLFSDLHANSSAAQRIVQQAQDVDVVIGAGDFANMRRNLHECIDILRDVDRPTILVAGNNETTDELRSACRHWSDAYVLHGQAISIEGLTFFGVGGGIPVTPFGPWSYDFSEEQAEVLLAGCPQGCVLVTHSPPMGAVDLSSRGEHLGSTALLETVRNAKPRLVVCGHIHASAGQHTLLGSTLVINAGPHPIKRQLDVTT